MEAKYNGWSNKETWLLNLHLTNTEWIYNEVKEVLSRKYEYSHQKEDALKDYVENLFNFIIYPFCISYMEI